MKMVTRQVTIKLLTTVALTILAFAAAANANPNFTGKFNLPYEVHWGKAVLPAGQYSIRMQASMATALVQSADGKIAIVTPLSTTDDTQKGAAGLFVTLSGSQRRVRFLNLPESGVSLVYEPLTTADRELLSKAGRLEAVPVIISSK